MAGAVIRPPYPRGGLLPVVQKEHRRRRLHRRRREGLTLSVAAGAQNATVLVAVEAQEGRGALLSPLAEGAVPAGPVREVEDLVEAVAGHERAGSPRWLWAATPSIYPRLLAAGVRVERCHDFELTEALLLGHEGRWKQS